MPHPSIRFVVFAALCLASLWSCSRTTAESRRPDAPAPMATASTATAVHAATEGSAAPAAPAAARADAPPPPIGERLTLTEAQWRARLTPEQYHVLREQGTERAFTGTYWNNHEPGTYVCSACGAPLFASETKFDSGTGWPSFYQPIESGRVAETRDETLGMARTEVHCARCGGHLGHVFEDGPRPTGLRYCIDSVSLEFHPAR
jgi:peptide-methionine (R)-S-oxide reductase